MMSMEKFTGEQARGHYLAMTNASFTSVACGFSGSWGTQNYYGPLESTSMRTGTFRAEGLRGLAAGCTCARVRPSLLDRARPSRAGAGLEEST